MERQVNCVVIGAGERGTCYSAFATAFPDRLRQLFVLNTAYLVYSLAT